MDGTDHIGPASLRSLDQVLVLVTGKRRHASSLVNANGTVGCGSVGGIRGKVAGFDFDLANTYGLNSFDYRVMNSLNVSLPGSSGQRNFYGGQLFARQNSTTSVLLRLPELYVARKLLLEWRKNAPGRAIWSIFVGLKWFPGSCSRRVYCEAPASSRTRASQAFS